MKKYKLFVLAVLTIISCNQKENRNEQSPKNVKTILGKKIGNKKVGVSATEGIINDTLTISNRSAIFVEPTDVEIEKRKKEIGEEDFYIGADDNMFYLNEATESFRKRKLKIVNIKSRNSIKFEMENGNKTILNLKGEDELWQIYLFDPKVKPKKIDITDSENEYKTYFK